MLRVSSFRHSFSRILWIALAFIMLASGQLLAKDEGKDEDGPKGPVYLDEAQRLEVLSSQTGWKLVRLHDELDPTSHQDLFFIHAEGIDSLPFNQQTKDELREDFGLVDGEGNDTSEDVQPQNLIVMHKELAEAIETGSIPPEYEQYSDVTEGCFGWNDKQKSKSWSFDEWSNQRQFDLTDNVTGSLEVQIPMSGEANLNIKYRIKKSFCIPYKFDFKEVRAWGQVELLGDGDLSAQATLTGHWDWEWQLMNPKLGRIEFNIGPFPVWIDFFLPTYAGIDLDVSATGTVNVGSDFGAEGSFDYTCTLQTCSGSHDFDDSFGVDGVTGSLEVQVDAQAWARMMVRAELYDDSIAYAQAGARGFVEAGLWGYYGNACGDGDGDGHNETVRALAADLEAGYDIVYGIGGLLLPNRDWTTPGDRFQLGWLDLLGTGGSDALAPMMVGPASSIAGRGTTYTVKMRPCYPYDERVDFTVGPGGWSGDKFIAAPKSSDPTQNSSAVGRGWNNPGLMTLVVTATTDSKGRDLSATFERTLDVQPQWTPPAITSQPASQTVQPGGTATFSVTASGGSLSYQWYKDGAALADGGQYSGSTTPTLTVSNADGTVTGAYHVTASNPLGSAASQAAQLDLNLETAPEIRVLRNIDRVELPSGTTYDFGSQPATVPMSRPFLICNDGDQPLLISNVSNMVTGASFFQLDTPTPPIASQQCQYVRVRFLASAPGAHQGQLSIDNNDPDGGEDPYILHLVGTATPSAPEIHVVRLVDRLDIPSGSTHVMVTTPVDDPQSVALDICNLGDGMLNLDQVTDLVSGDPRFSQIRTPGDRFIAPGECDYVRVRFLSAQAGTYYGTVSVGNNDADEDPYLVHLQATAE